MTSMKHQGDQPRTPAEPTPARSSRSPWIWVGVAFGIWVFLHVAVLTLPKYGRRKAAIDQRAAGRSHAWQQQLKHQGAVTEADSGGAGDWLLIGAVSAGGALVVAGLALAALRRRPLVETATGRAPPREPS